VYITSKYLSPTDRLGARYRASIVDAEGHKCNATVPYDHALSQLDNASEAVRRLIRRNCLNVSGIWDSFLLPLGPDDFYVAIPSGPGADRTTYSIED
jgi:hypothetical protein